MKQMRFFSKFVFLWGVFLVGFGAVQADDTVEYRLTLEGVPFVVRVHSSHLDAKYAANISLSSRRGDRGFVEEVNDKGSRWLPDFSSKGLEDPLLRERF